MPATLDLVREYVALDLHKPKFNRRVLQWAILFAFDQCKFTYAEVAGHFKISVEETQRVYAFLVVEILSEPTQFQRYLRIGKGLKQALKVANAPDPIAAMNRLSSSVCSVPSVVKIPPRKIRNSKSAIRN